ncbi:hypothetical protein SPWS13_2951 [Shewanella putrefaciens]|nr:hypothetical protein SPWS13_2951 [Shewanella putrefaciens]
MVDLAKLLWDLQPAPRIRAEPTKITVSIKQNSCMMNPSFLEQALVAGFKSKAKS